MFSVLCIGGGRHCPGGQRVILGRHHNWHYFQLPNYSYVCFKLKYCLRRAPRPYTFGGTSQNAIRGPHCFQLNSIFLYTSSKVSARKSDWICVGHHHNLHHYCQLCSIPMYTCILHAQGGEVGHGKKPFFPPAAHWWCCHQDGATKTATMMVPTKHPTRWCQYS